MMISTVVGGAMLPHAPQFFTMPETEDKKNVEHVREVAADLGKKLRALEKLKHQRGGAQLRGPGRVVGEVLDESPGRRDGIVAGCGRASGDLFEDLA